MKYVNNGVSRNVIKDSDINLSESFENQNLAEVLSLYRDDLNTLKSNVKWLAKYGGVGGSGGGSGSGSTNVKLKYKVDINYKTTAGIESSDSFVSGTKSNKIITKDGDFVTVTVTLQKCMANTPYYVRISYGGNTYTHEINSIKLSTSQSFRCSGNSDVSVLVYAVPDDMPETVIKIFTTAKEASLKLILDNGATISDGGVMLQDYVNSAKIVGQLKNFLPEIYLCSIEEITINNIAVTNLNIQDTTTDIRTFEVEIPTGIHFISFGIYEIKMRYIYNGVEETVKRTYVYKSVEPYVYCYGESNFVYSNPVELPNFTNYVQETIRFRIYPELGESTKSYNVKYTISYEGKSSSENISNTLYCASNTNFSLQFPNKYSKTEFNETIRFKQITIKFEIGEVVYNYYIYVGKMDEVSYIFKTSNNELFYNAIHSCTAEANDDTSPITTFPFSLGKFKVLSNAETHNITKVADKTSLTNRTISVYGNVTGSGLSGGYVTNGEIENAAESSDMLLSFGLNYNATNLDDPILSVKVNEGYTITLYFDKIKYGTLQYVRWNLPKDNKYHLILLYYKPFYSVDGASCVSGPPAITSTFIWCIDGVFETLPILMSSAESVAFSPTSSSITYYPGNWDFNFIGVASFNAKPMSAMWESVGPKTDTNPGYAPEVLRYVLDFDPIIPANYYQAYCQFQKTNLSNMFDSGIYSKLYSSVSGSEKGINYYKNYNKFISTDIVTIGKLTELPIYIIEPIAQDYDTNINDFLFKTFKGGYSEASTPPSVECNFRKCIIQGNEIQYESAFGQRNNTFNITYQGSSTLKYGVKNFEISANDYKDSAEELHTIVWTPDKNVFLPENSFTLKADVVDSSHSNNAIIGKFVNNYMKDASFNKEKKYKTCLEGFPILLFMSDVTRGGQENNTIFLGIYSFNLGRKSVYNLGYKELIKDNCTYIQGDGNAEAYILNTKAIHYPNNYRVAEVQANSPVLFDYSLYDYNMLENNMLGDFFNYDGISESLVFSDNFLRPLKGLNKLIYDKFIKDLDNYYIPYTFKNDNSELFGYYKRDKGGLFNVLQLNFNYSGSKESSPYYYYKSSNNNRIIQVPQLQPVLILDKNLIKTIKPYLHIGDNNLSIIGNPKYQFHLICSETGVPIGDTLYYVEELSLAGGFNSTSDDYFNYDTLLRYYVVCMLFAMVDSVQKNLTIRCKNFDPLIGNEWFVGFYDMDTSFGVDNVGNPVDYRAFSDYINEEGKIISDYYAEDSEFKEGSGFDVPSSFLFLAAKYLNIITLEDNPILGERTYEDHEHSVVLRTPFNYWLTLRSGELSDLNTFFAKYVDNHFSNINPLIWNLNYMYKYFSESGTGKDETDTEMSKFNGTRRYIRRNWMEQRLNIVDVLFGIRNNHTVGKSDTDYICKQQVDQSTNNQKSVSNFISNSFVSKTMFPLFSKGVTVKEIKVEATASPKTPVVMLQESGNSTLYIANNSGKFDTIVASIPDNADIGFFGTTTLKTLSDCGQFLLNDDEENKITNDVIQDITINKFPLNGAQSIGLYLALLKGAKTIKVNEKGLTTFKGNLFLIQSELQQGDNVVSRVLDNVTFNKCNFGGDLLINGQNTLTITNLVITNCSAKSLNLTGVIVKNLTLSGNSFETYNIQGTIPNITITDGSAKSVAINVINNDISVTLNTGQLTSLNLKGSIRSFSNNTTTPYCTSVNISDISPQNVTMLLKGFTNYTGKMLIKCESTVKNLTFSAYNNNKCTEYDFIASNLQKITLTNSGFKNNYVLEKINLNGNILINQIPLDINTNGLFYGCSKLPTTYCVPTVSTKEFKVLTTDLSTMYEDCKINLNDVINIFNNLNTSNVKSLNLNSMFFGCTQVSLRLTLSGSNYTLNTADYDNFKNALIKIKLGKSSVTFSSIFRGTQFEFLDRDLVNLFKVGSTYSLVNPYIHVPTDSGLNGSTCITDDCLMDGITSVTLGTTEGASKFKVFKKEGEVYKLLTNYKLHDVLNNGTLTTINCLNPFTNSSVCVDLDQCIPSTVTNFSNFNLSSSANVKNLEKMFDGCTKTTSADGKLTNVCSVTLDTFLSSSAKVSKTDGEKIQLYDLFFANESDDELETKAVPKVNLKLASRSSYTNDSYVFQERASYLPLCFDKTCTASLFKLIMEYLKSRQYEINETECMLYNLIPGLFSYCTITNVTTFLNLIVASDGLSYFTNRLINGKFINYIDLTYTFRKCSLKTKYDEDVNFDVKYMWDKVFDYEDDVPTQIKAKVLSLKQTFEETKQEKIMEVLPISNIFSMYRTFYNCKFNCNINSDSIVLSDPTNQAKFLFKWSWKENFPLLPPKFFSGMMKNCNFNECFACESITQDNLQGLLPINLDQMWWDSNQEFVPNNLFRNALLHPIIYTYEDRTEYYIYPTFYTTKFNSVTDSYSHVIIPLLGESESLNILYLFEDDKTPLRLNSRLPMLPKYASNTSGLWSLYYMLKEKKWKVEINKSKAFYASTSMSSSSFKLILPGSLFLVLNDINFKGNLNMSASTPVVLLESGYYLYNDTLDWSKNDPTPGGVYWEEINNKIRNFLFTSI